MKGYNFEFAVSAKISEKVIDSLEYGLYQYLQLAENAFSLPYMHSNEAFQITLELFKEEDREFLFIYSPWHQN